MASTIGTNIVQDPDEFFKLFEAIERGLEKLVHNREVDEYKKSLETISKHVQKGGLMHFAFIDTKFKNELEYELKHAGIAYLPMPTTDGNLAISVMDKDIEKFEKLQFKVFSRSTDFAKEVSAESMIEDITTDDRFRNTSALVYDFKSNDERILFQNILNKNGIIYGYDDASKKIISNPDSVFKPLGGDVTNAIVEASITYAVYNEDSEKAAMREVQRHNREVLNNFAENYKKGNLCEIKSEIDDSFSDFALSTLKINNAGVIEYTPIGSNQPRLLKNISKDASIEEIHRALAKTVQEMLGDSRSVILHSDKIDDSKFVLEGKLGAPGDALNKDGKVNLRRIIYNDKHIKNLTDACAHIIREGKEEACKNSLSTNNDKFKHTSRYIQAYVKKVCAGKIEDASLKEFGVTNQEIKDISSNLDGLLNSGASGFGFELVARDNLKAYLGKLAGVKAADLDREEELEEEQ